MEKKVFWGEQGEYGPFTKQDDGWPNAGEVIRHYRRINNMSAEGLAKRYREELAKQDGNIARTSISARWILKMEQKNQVPADLTRRRILAKMLDIPLQLLGLASLEMVTRHTATDTLLQYTSASLEQTSFAELTTYEEFARIRWLLSYTGEETLEEVVKNILELEQYESQSSGDFQKQIWKTLNSHYQLASDIHRHRGNFSAAWNYANNAVRVTKLININDFLAAALYRRGYVSLEWSIYGNQVFLGIMNHQPEKKLLNASITDFEEAIIQARVQLKGAIYLELSRAQALLQNTSLSRHLTISAENMVNAGKNIHDPLEQILLEGALSGLNEGMYLLGKTASLIALGRTTTAIETLDDLDELKNGKGIARNQVRRLAYADVLRAEASLGTKDYITSATRAINALQIFQDIQTTERIAWINTIHQTLNKKCGHHPEVKRLGKMLTDHYKKRLMEAKQ